MSTMSTIGTPINHTHIVAISLRFTTHFTIHITDVGIGPGVILITPLVGVFPLVLDPHITTVHTVPGVTVMAPLDIGVIPRTTIMVDTTGILLITRPVITVDSGAFPLHVAIMARVEPLWHEAHSQAEIVIV